jgi:hypothetical protein
MNIDQFWHLIAQSHGTPLQPHERLQQLLETLPPEDIITFDRIFWGYAKLSYRALLWMAFYVRDGGCSDDGFDYCRFELIIAGREAFDRAVVDPDRLAEDTYAKLDGYEEAAYAAVQAYEGVTGETFDEGTSNLPEFDMQHEYGRLGLDPNYRLDTDPVMAIDFDDEDAVKQLLPKVWARYGN